MLLAGVGVGGATTRDDTKAKPPGSEAQTAPLLPQAHSVLAHSRTTQHSVVFPLVTERPNPVPPAASHSTTRLSPDSAERAHSGLWDEQSELRQVGPAEDTEAAVPDSAQPPAQRPPGTCDFGDPFPSRSPGNW